MMVESFILSLERFIAYWLAVESFITIFAALVDAKLCVLRLNMGIRCVIRSCTRSCKSVCGSLMDVTVPLGWEDQRAGQVRRPASDSFLSFGMKATELFLFIFPTP